MARFHRTVPAPPLPVGKDYTFYRPDVRADFERCCAHCLRHEDYGGTTEHYELDHFRPQKRFPDQINDFHNLYYSCHRCNQRKSVSWPSEQEQRAEQYFVDLCQEDFSTHYNLREDGTLELRTKAAEYTAKKLRLNSPELVEQRANILKAGCHIDKPLWPIK